MNKTGRARISQCMIVKNEEKNIERALSWGKGIAAEQIVVDTGSTDRTVEIARELGAKVYSFSWIDDFSAAKNFAISKARYSWIAFLDADEYFQEEDASELLLLLQKLHPHACDGVETRWVHFNDEGKIIAMDTQIRIFRNQSDIRYTRKIHEHLAAADGRNLRIWDASKDLSIFHTGYAPKQMQEKKSNERNLRMILKEIEENPDEYVMYGYLGNEYIAAGEWEKAKEAYQKVIALTPETMHGKYDLETSGFPVRLLELLCVLADTGESELLELYKKVSGGWPEEGDYDYLMGNYYAGHQRFGEAEEYLLRALDKQEHAKNRQCCSKIFANRAKIDELLALCRLNRGNCPQPQKEGERETIIKLQQETNAEIPPTARKGISQCMIVKNEEKNIVQALSWGRGIVDEQIVVDTGSTDQTVELAKKMGAKVYSFSWIDDFAAAKNFAINKASGEWIAFLDADEYFPGEDAKKLKKLLGEIGSREAVLTGWVQLKDSGEVLSVDSQIRIFRNLPNLRYHRRIHEYLAVEEEKGQRRLYFWDASGDLAIFHTGYGEAASEKKRSDRRNIRLLQMELEENPGDYELLGYLGNEYESFEEWDLAEDAYRKAVASMPKHVRGEYDGTTSGCVFRLLELLCVLPGKKEKEILDFYRWADASWPEEGDFSYVVGKYFAVHGNFSEGENYLKKALATVETYGTASRSSLVAAKIMDIYELLAMCCYNQGNLQDCVKLTTALLKENPYLMTTAVLLISAFHQDMLSRAQEKSGAGQVAELLGKSFYHFSSLKDRMFVLRAATDAGYPELVEVIRSLFSSEELAQIDRALNKD